MNVCVVYVVHFKSKLLANNQHTAVVVVFYERATVNVLFILLFLFYRQVKETVKDHQTT